MPLLCCRTGYSDDLLILTLLKKAFKLDIGAVRMTEPPVPAAGKSKLRSLVCDYSVPNKCGTFNRSVSVSERKLAVEVKKKRMMTNDGRAASV